MKFIVELPIETYRICLLRFEVKSQAYRLLKSGVVTLDDQDNFVLIILCDAEGAKTIHHMVAETCPELINTIRQSLDVPSDIKLPYDYLGK